MLRRCVLTNLSARRLHYPAQPSAEIREMVLPVCYYHRLLTMFKGKVVKSVFKALYNLNDQGSQTWIKRVSELARRYGIDVNETASIGSVQFI